MTFKALWSFSSKSKPAKSAAATSPRNYGGAIIYEVNVSDSELRRKPRGTLADLPSLDEGKKARK